MRCQQIRTGVVSERKEQGSADGRGLGTLQQDEGSKTIERKKVVDHDWSPARDANLEHLVREDLDLVTYFWKRIPGTSFTMLISVVGTPTEPGGKVVLTPTLRAPRPCPAGAGPNASLSLHADGSCWTSSYTAFPSVYHRLDLLDQSAMPARTMAAPFGGAPTCLSSITCHVFFLRTF